MNTENQTLRISRRDMLSFASAGVLAAAGIGLFGTAARADKKMAMDAMAKVIKGRDAKSGRITLELPQIAENGNTVPMTVEVDSPMTEADYVKSVYVYADGNPLPDVASFHFTPANGIAKASIRMRLAKTQNVVAVAEMSDGSVYQASTEVKVTIGGCGG